MQLGGVSMTRESPTQQALVQFTPFESLTSGDGPLAAIHRPPTLTNGRQYSASRRVSATARAMAT